MRWLAAVAMSMAALSSALAQPGDGMPGTVESACATPVPVTVRAIDPQDTQVACEGAARALGFLRGAGFALPEQAQIDVVDRMPGELEGRAVGCYLRDERRILLLAYGPFAAGGEWFRTPVDRELYRSAASHEMAHAVVGCVARPSALPVAAHEYVAYVVMFATMDDALRARVLARFPGTGFDSSLAINPIVYYSDPLRFATEAWRHYLKRRDRTAYLRAVAAGDVVQEFPTEGP